MELVSYKDSLIKTKCEVFDFENPPFDPLEFAQELVKYMYERDGIGLAANQVGVPYRIFAMRGHPENYVCINPRIVDASNEDIILDEGCLTYPGFSVKIKRPRHIRVRFQTPNGDTRTDKFTGMSARIFQHELDHLDGLTMKDRCSHLVMSMAIKKANKKRNTSYNILDF